MRVKICGITRLVDAMVAVGEGADALGFIFVKDSPRFIPPDDAAAIVRMLPPFVTAVGVFVNEPRASILQVIADAGITCLQLHGEEASGETEGYSIPVVKSFRVGPAFDPAALGQYRTSAYLLDTFAPGQHGGTGRTFDWRVAAEARRFGRIILSGGLNAGNVCRAINEARPYAVDINSGVESAPGIKDREKIKALFAAVRSMKPDDARSFG